VHYIEYRRISQTVMGLFLASDRWGQVFLPTFSASEWKQAKTTSHRPQCMVLDAGLRTHSCQILQEALVLSPDEGGCLVWVGNVKRSGLLAVLVFAIARRFAVPAGKVLINESGWLLD
jgi:hypothetical protein